jgi:hypothetical protein
MSEQRNQLHHLKIASPCSADWNSMAGDERVRFCGQCGLHVYNISEMSPEAAIALITGTERRICARFFRRSDGTVLTKDCPTGLRAVRARTSRIAGAIFSAALSLVSSSAARATSGMHLQGSGHPPITIKRAVNPNAEEASASLVGTIYDSQGAVIANANIILLNERTGKEQKAASNEEGVFHVEGLEAGEYTLRVESPGFVSFKTHLALNSRESVQVSVTLEVAALMGDVVLVNGEKEL